MSKTYRQDIVSGTGADLKAAMADAGPEVEKNLAKGVVMRSISHAVDPAAAADKRCSVVILFSTLGEGDIPTSGTTEDGSWTMAE
jgi:hypothetical protein